MGSSEVSLKEMTNAYAAFADAGKVRQNTTIHEIKDKFNKQIYIHQSQSSRALSEEGAYLISNILADQSARSFMFGSSLNIASKTVAVKTGTTDDSRDAWAIGYTPDIAIGVWVGNNDNQPMISGGADMAGPIWRSLMTSAIGSANPMFAKPLNVVERYACYGGGLANTSGTNTYTEIFLSSALPTESCYAATPQPTPEPESAPVEPDPEVVDDRQESDEEVVPDPQPVEPPVTGTQSLRMMMVQ
ncbi:hypothetical protein B7Z17_03760 [Candidatus Saccharibacteria bacterium 32-49-10]|nr:MAG: hypothetical protein B7Z17_03760 [Candidatus Saccharibacteria bacterium 32-49-10]